MSASSFAATCAIFIAQVDIRIVVNRYVNTYMLDHTISMTLLLLNVVRKKKSVVGSAHRSCTRSYIAIRAKRVHSPVPHPLDYTPRLQVSVGRAHKVALTIRSSTTRGGHHELGPAALITIASPVSCLQRLQVRDL